MLSFEMSAGRHRLIVNCGDDSGMEVPHLHLHVIGGRKLAPMDKGI